MSRPARVLLFIGSLKTGGSEAHVARLLSGLDPASVEAELMCLKDEGHALAEMRSRVPVHIANLRRGLAGRIRGWREMKAVLRRVRPDFLHSYGYTCNVYTPLLAMGTRVRAVTTRRTEEPSAGKRRMYRYLAPLTDHVLAVSEAAACFAQEAEGLRSSKIHVIPNGIEPERIAPAPWAGESVLKLGTVGRVHADKGTDLLLDAFCRLERPDLRLSIAGPVYTDWGRQQQRRVEGHPQIEFLGDLPDVRAFLSGLDLFLLPSLTEGMSMALLEAMAVGLPVIATQVGGNTEVLAGGEAGILVPPTSEALERAIAGLVEDPARATLLARRGWERVRREYPQDRMLRRYEAFYREVLEGGRASPH